ncbi:hypothetical protein ACIBM4_29140 [Streptomyces sp. NPDC050256]
MRLQQVLQGADQQNAPTGDANPMPLPSMRARGQAPMHLLA